MKVKNCETSTEPTHIWTTLRILYFGATFCVPSQAAAVKLTGQYVRHLANAYPLF